MRLAHPQKIAEAKKRLIRVALQNRWMISGILLVSIISGVLILIQMYALSILIHAAFIEEWIPEIHRTLFLILVVAILFRALSAWISSRIGMSLAIRLKTAYRKRLMYKMHELGPNRLRDNKAGELIGLHLNGIEKLDDFFSLYIPAAIRMSVIPVMIFAVVMWVDWPSGLVFLFTGPLIPLFMYLIGTQAGEKIKKQWNSFRKMNAHFLDTIQGMDTIKLYGREKSAGRSINHISRMFRMTTMRVLKIAFLSGMVLELAASVSTAVVAVEIGVRLVTGMIGFQTGLFVLLLAPEFYLPFRTFGSSHHAGMEGAEAGAHLFDILDEKGKDYSGNGKIPVSLPETLRLNKSVHKHAEGNGRPPVNIHDTLLQIEPLKGQPSDNNKPIERLPETPWQLRLENLHFGYDPDEKVIRGIHLTINHGEIHTITGRSGEGKTTLLNLIAQLAHPDSGAIYVNHMMLDEKILHEWRKKISLVPQFPHFFRGTIIDNIRYGKQNASDDEIVEAAKMAHADGFINQLTDGYHTDLGENGVNLSGGEKQRIALARAFLKRPPLLLLDEPCASLNDDLETAILKSLKTFAQNRIVVIASHKPGTILKSDRISLLKDGVILTGGSADELFPNGRNLTGIEYGDQ